MVWALHGIRASVLIIAGPYVVSTTVGVLRAHAGSPPALGAVPGTVGGLTFMLPMELSLYRGWVGEITWVDQHHRRRLRRPGPAMYCLVTLLLQLGGFTLAGGARLHLGLAFIRGDGPSIGPRWFRLPRAALVDVVRVYTLVVPLLAFGSVWEFLWQAG